jgi:hypothetical protein
VTIDRVAVRYIISSDVVHQLTGSRRLRRIRQLTPAARKCILDMPDDLVVCRLRFHAGNFRQRCENSARALMSGIIDGFVAAVASADSW